MCFTQVVNANFYWLTKHSLDFKTNISYKTFSATRAAANAIGQANYFVKSTNTLYIGINLGSADGTNNQANIIRFVDEGPATSLVDVLSDLETSSKGTSIRALATPVNNDYFPIIGAMGYYDKLVGLITRYILDYTNPSPYLTNQLSFFGECAIDDYYRLEFSLPIYMNMWPKIIHARDSTTNFAIIYDYYSGPETT